MTPSLHDMERIVADHASLDDPMDAAIWIRRGRPEAWLVEVIPTLGEDPDAGSPVCFNPGRYFRYPLNLIAGNLDALKSAIGANPELARDVSEGEILHGKPVGMMLIEFARDARGDA